VHIEDDGGMTVGHAAGQADEGYRLDYIQSEFRKDS